MKLIAVIWFLVFVGLDRCSVIQVFDGQKRIMHIGKMSQSSIETQLKQQVFKGYINQQGHNGILGGFCGSQEFNFIPYGDGTLTARFGIHGMVMCSGLRGQAEDFVLRILRGRISIIQRQVGNIRVLNVNSKEWFDAKY